MREAMRFVLIVFIPLNIRLIYKATYVVVEERPFLPILKKNHAISRFLAFPTHVMQ